MLLVAIAYILLADRKIWAAVQMRRGPNVVGPFGLLTPIADAVTGPCNSIWMIALRVCPSETCAAGTPTASAGIFTTPL